MDITSGIIDESAKIIATERLFDIAKYSEIPISYLPSWFPDKFAQSTLKPGVAEHHATKREQILGAALAVIANFPEECKWGGAIKGKRVYELITAKSKTWWPQEGKPPIKDEASIKLINKWLNTLK